MIKKCRWKSSEIDLLLNSKDKSCKELLKLFPNRSWNSILEKSRNLKFSLKRKSRFNIKRLLEDSNAAFYWVGFLLADGHFSKTGSSIRIKVSLKDKNHLIKYTEFLQNKNEIRDVLNIKTPYSDVNISDKLNFNSILTKFSLNNTKTFTPPDFTKYTFTNEQIFSLVVGFFDGDGHVNTSKFNNNYITGAIRVHSSWLNNLIYIKNFILKYLNCTSNTNPRLDNRGYSLLSLNKPTMLKIKDKILELNLPVMERKWDKVAV